jgi:GntR family transcriptional regulator
MILKKDHMEPQLPLYYKIEQDFKKKIETGTYKVGDLLPSERELIEMYGVSRLTAREAINRLVNDGLVIKIQGKGTYVASPRKDHRIGSLYSGGEEMLLHYEVIETRVLKIDKVRADEALSKMFEVPQEEELIYIERVRSANKTPAAYMKCYIPYRYVEGIESIDLENRSLYRTLEDDYHLQLHEAQEVIEAVKADAKSARYLDIPENTPVLLNHRLTYLMDGTVIEHEIVVYRSDVFKYYNRLVGRGEGRLV